MVRAVLFKTIRRRAFWPALVLCYALLLQVVLGNAAASAHAFALAQQDALGLAILCVEEGIEGRRLAGPGEVAGQPDPRDCIACKIASAAGSAMPAAAPYDPPLLYPIRRGEIRMAAVAADAAMPPAAVYDSDRSSRAPPARA